MRGEHGAKEQRINEPTGLQVSGTERLPAEQASKRAEEALRRKTRQQEQLLKIARHLTASLDVKEILTRIGVGAKEILSAHGCAIYLLEEDGRTLTPVIAIEPPYEEEILLTPIDVETSFTGQAVKARRGLIFNDAGADPSGQQIPGTPVEEEHVIVAPFVVGGQVLGAMCLNRVGDLFSEKDLALAETLGTYAAIALKNAQTYQDLQHEVEERKRAEEALRQRNRELAMLNRASQAFISSLDLDQVLVTVLKEVRRLLDVTGCSVWLVDPATDEVVCRQVIGPQSGVVRGWRLAPEEGLVGWVARYNEILIVPNARTDERHFNGVDQQTGLNLHSILAIPLRVKQAVIGVLEVVDTEAGRFGARDVVLVESLATTAAIAIEHARLYEQARRDAQTRAVLLHEVNHRVKNNLSTIVGLLYAERRRARAEDQFAYQSITENLINRVQGLAMVHSLLSASEWAPLSLSELAAQVVHSSLQTLPCGKHVSIDVAPSPVLVTPDQAHNLALVINELVTSTTKYALQERDTAQITIRIRLDDDTAARTVLFEFRDNGPGYPEEVLQLERYGVGFDLIWNIVHKGLRGELSLHNDHGAVAVLQFRAEVE